jgi:periplasmic divalent cation tolerance protein
MPKTAVSARLVLTTAGSPEEAALLGRVLVEERLAACVTLLPGTESIYRWKGAIEQSAETMMLIKTDCDQLEPLEARLYTLHSYETPEFLVLKVESGGLPYLNWLESCLGTAGQESDRPQA